MEWNLHSPPQTDKIKSLQTQIVLNNQGAASRGSAPLPDKNASQKVQVFAIALQGAVRILHVPKSWLYDRKSLEGMSIRCSSDSRWKNISTASYKSLL